MMRKWKKKEPTGAAAVIVVTDEGLSSSSSSPSATASAAEASDLTRRVDSRTIPPQRTPTGQTAPQTCQATAPLSQAAVHLSDLIYFANSIAMLGCPSAVDAAVAQIMSAVSQHRNPFGWYYERGSVIVDRKSDASRRKSYELMKASLQKGFHMCIYPEGTRNRTQEPLKRFYDGAFKLAADSGYPIIPAVIFNTKKALPANRFFYLMPHKLSIHFLQPIEVENRNAESLKVETFNTMAAYYLKHQ